jgi:hypothetical protein
MPAVSRQYNVGWQDGWVGKDLERSTRGLIKVLFHYSYGGTEENH